ncbi:hypothetical protein C8C77_11068 [Halanaerobium saccharolyticum]|uniref:Glycoside hydrolase family 127 protein n=1 Tax=Halanaerobium saccharolyticum TaxID=43595 RepID=A0A4R7Z852_9FIRM|nr:beta-L-arabinofuranosidase domain-containing protein [Halanaerobium saccharolyticum]RAK08162.1 hypothetical protein C7958_11168 [Halanaerobium saccharolyticum]TDW04369.1 hypothetical protein C8C77_11068 [Halanaerobium saccharolyticum]TDX59660.1 hypothetical protein C7956_11368 [Halanaerobium saccharolyticum]
MEKMAEVLSEIPMKNVEIDDKFWNHRLEKNRIVTLDHQYQQLIKTGRLDNFKKAAGLKDGDFFGMFFNDSDVYKWLEAASYTLANKDDSKLSKKINETIELITSAQQEDGYLNTYFILEEPEKKWTNLGMMHELYCAGHLFQAATAHYLATGENSLLNVACKFANLIDQKFRQSGHTGVPGHEEIELALVELYRVTEKENYLKLSEYFINNRGKGYFKKEVDNLKNIAGSDFEQDIENFNTFEMSKFYREFFLDEEGNYDGSYAQDHLPVRDQKEAAGHAVRAMYLYSGMTDVALETGDQLLIKALEKLWNNMTKKKMYITGGIGPTHDFEGFTENYDLPNKTAYAESCAAVGSIMWNYRLLKMTGDAKFANLMERTLYNGLLSGVGLSGDKFFYVNPLASDGNHHRKGWFHVSCCPPNIARLLASLQKYIYLKSDNKVYVNLFISGELKFDIADQQILLKQSSEYPWDDSINYNVKTEANVDFTLNIRYPDWAKKVKVLINEKEEKINVENGYLMINRNWENNDQVKLIFEMPVKRIKAHPKVVENKARFALKKGPLVYCLEEVDNEVPLNELIITRESKINSEYEEMLKGIHVLKGDALKEDLSEWENELYKDEKNINYKKTNFKAVPYYIWDHREPGEMRVWLRE